MMNIKARKLSIVAFIILTFGMWILYLPIRLSLDQYLAFIFKPMAEYKIAIPVFGFSFGLIPLICHAYWRKKDNRTLSKLLIFNLISIVIGFGMCILLFLIIDLLNLNPANNPLLPDYIVWLPFPGFWNIGLPFCTLLFPGVLYLSSKQKVRNKHSNMVLDRIGKFKDE